MVSHNVGAGDAAVRILIGVSLLGLAIRYNARPFIALGFGALALLVLGTAFSHACPLYVLLGINTLPASPPSAANGGAA